MSIRGRYPARPPSSTTRARRSEPSQESNLSLGSDRADVDRLRPLVACLGLVLHARALGERAVAVGFDAAVVDEQVLAAFIGCDEAEALLVAEPLNGACCHVFLHGVLRAASAVVAHERPSASACTAFAERLSSGRTGAPYHGQ